MVDIQTRIDIQEHREQNLIQIFLLQLIMGVYIPFHEIRRNPKKKKGMAFNFSCFGQVHTQTQTERVEDKHMLQHDLLSLVL